MSYNPNQYYNPLTLKIEEMSTSTSIRNNKRKSGDSKKVVVPVVKKQLIKKSLPETTLEGKLIKISARTHGDWTFYSGMLVVEEDVYNKVVEWGKTLGFTGNYNPYFTSEKEYNGEVTKSYFITYDIKGESVKNVDEFRFLNDLADAKAPIKTTLGATSSTFVNKNGDDTKKFVLELVYDTTTQVV